MSEWHSSREGCYRSDTNRGQGTCSMEISGSECAAGSNSANDSSFVRIVGSRSRCSNANTRIGTSLAWIPQTRASVYTVGADRCSRRSDSLTSRLDGASMSPVIRVSRTRNLVLTASRSAEERLCVRSNAASASWTMYALIADVVSPRSISASNSAAPFVGIAEQMPIQKTPSGMVARQRTNSRGRYVAVRDW